jgi:CheY-like chemotaxis protein
MPHKLLLADDSVTIQRVIELTFADEDIEVTVVGDGRQAIERVRSDRPDIVLADIAMPERDGYEVAAFVKGDPRLAHIPVILLTGAFEPLDEDRARQVGCDGVLVKPFEPQMVINRVRELLSGRRPVAAAVGAPARATDDIFGIELDAPLPPPPAPAVPAAPAKTGDALEDYFDRLDAAFANVSGPASRTSQPAQPDEDLSGGISELQPPPAERTPGEDPMTSWDPDLTAGFGPAKPHLANAFAALLAAEQGQVVPQPGVALAPPARISDDVIEDIVGRVIARLTDDAVRRTVVETAERLVRDEIDRIKREARASR